MLSVCQSKGEWSSGDISVGLGLIVPQSKQVKINSPFLRRGLNCVLMLYIRDEAGLEKRGKGNCTYLFSK